MRVLRLCSVYEVPAEGVGGRAVHFDPIGGMQSHTASLTRALDRAAVEQQVVTTRPPGVPRLEHLAHGVVRRVGFPFRHLRQGYGACAAAVLARDVRGIDLVHAHLGEDLAVLPLARAAARLFGAPLVVTVHTSLRHTLCVGDLRSLVLRSVGAAIEVSTYRRADGVIALTARLAERLAAAGVPRDRVDVLPSGIEREMFAATGDDPLPGVPRPRVVFAGRLCAQKGVLALVRAASLLGPGAHVVLVGDGPLRPAVEALVRDLGLSARVHLVGAVHRARVADYLATADVFALPSQYEELGTAIVEAMTAGLPVVAARVGGIPDVVADGETGLLVPPDSPAALAAALGRLLADPGLAGRLGDEGRRRAAAYGWDSLAARVLDLYQRVVGSGAPARGT